MMSRWLDEMATPDAPLATDEHQPGLSNDPTGRDGPRVAILEPHDAFDGKEEEV